MKNRSRFKRYDGGDPLAPPVDLAEALDAIGEDVMAGYSPERAMREFLRRGGRDQSGLDDLARRVAERRRELTQRHNLDGTMQEVRELLDKAVDKLEKQIAAVGGVENITEENMPEAHIRGDVNTPYKCIGGAVFTMQRAGFARVGFISEPPPGNVTTRL